MQMHKAAMSFVRVLESNAKATCKQRSTVRQRLSLTAGYEQMWQHSHAGELAAMQDKAELLSGIAGTKQDSELLSGKEPV